MNRQHVTIYVDGACSGNPGPGGYAAILIRSQSKQTIEEIVSGYEAQTTNNRMELIAVIKALQALKTVSSVTIYSDSMYVISNGSKENMMKKSFLNKKKKIVNRDLWQSLYFYHQIHDIQFQKVKAHDDNDYNNRCDFIAKQEIVKNRETKTKHHDFLYHNPILKFA